MTYNIINNITIDTLRHSNGQYLVFMSQYSDAILSALISELRNVFPNSSFYLASCHAFVHLNYYDTCEIK